GAMQGDCSGSPILPAFRDTVERYAIPARLFEELIEGAAMDLTVRRYQTFEELRQYCYRVASVVGLVCIRIFGFADGRRQTADGSTGKGATNADPAGLPSTVYRLPPAAELH